MKIPEGQFIVYLPDNNYYQVIEYVSNTEVIIKQTFKDSKPIKVLIKDIFPYDPF